MNKTAPRAGAITKRIGFQVALAVNLTMAAAVAVFLVYDYLREGHQRLRDSVASLRTQALMIHQGVTGLRESPPEKLNEYLDDVCGRVNDADAPGHHIMVEIDGRVIQARAHHRDSTAIYEAVQSAAADSRSRANYQGQELIVGHYGQGGVTIFVAEYLADVRRAIRTQMLIRSVGVLFFGAVLALAVTIVIGKVVIQPLHRLTRTIHAIGAGSLGARAGEFRSTELSLLAKALDGMSRSLAEEEERRNLGLAKARRIQQRLLPQAGEVAGLDLAGRHEPAEDVAGDYYDVLPAAGGTFLLCVADIVGHGVPAAMTAAMLKILLLHAADHDAPPGEILRRLNRRFMAVSLPEDFASLFLAKWNPASSILCYASAGHEPGLFVSGDSPPRRMETTGPLIGLAEDMSWDTQSFRVQPGDSLLLLTDGLTEAMSVSGELFGRKRLADLLNRNRTSPPEAILREIEHSLLDHVKGERIADDFTLVVVKFT